MSDLNKLRYVAAIGRTQHATNKKRILQKRPTGTTPFRADELMTQSVRYGDLSMAPLPEDYPSKARVIEALALFKNSLRAAGMGYAATEKNFVYDSLRDPRAVQQFSITNEELNMIQSEGMQ